MHTRWLILTLLAGACVETAHVADDPRCYDERVGSVRLDELDAPDPEPAAPSEPPGSGGICDGSSAIRLVVMLALGPGSISDYWFLNPYGGSFFLIDGKCHYFAYDNTYPGLVEGTITPEMLEQLTAELKLDRLPELPSSKDAQRDHYNDTLLATPAHGLRCRDEQCRDPEATEAITQAQRWLSELAAHGQAWTGPLRVIANPLPYEPDPDAELELQTPAQPWPLSPTIRSLRWLVAFDSSTNAGITLAGEHAASIRALRRSALEAMRPPPEGYAPASVRVSDCGQTYRLLYREQLPGALDGELVRFLKRAWAAPVIASCTDFTGKELTPCPPEA